LNIEVKGLTLYSSFSTFCNTQKSNKKFQMTEEAIECVQKLKDFICQETMLYNIDFDKPLYIITDASQVACGSLLYPVSDCKDFAQYRDLYS